MCGVWAWVGGVGERHSGAPSANRICNCCHTALGDARCTMRFPRSGQLRPDTPRKPHLCPELERAPEQRNLIVRDQLQKQDEKMCMLCRMHASAGMHHCQPLPMPSTQMQLPAQPAVPPPRQTPPDPSIIPSPPAAAPLRLCCLPCALAGARSPMVACGAVLPKLLPSYAHLLNAHHQRSHGRLKASHGTEQHVACAWQAGPHIQVAQVFTACRHLEARLTIPASPLAGGCPCKAWLACVVGTRLPLRCSDVIYHGHQLQGEGRQATAEVGRLRRRRSAERRAPRPCSCMGRLLAGVNRSTLAQNMPRFQRHIAACGCGAAAPAAASAGCMNAAQREFGGAPRR